MSRPLSGAIWGFILGIAVAIVIQQQGIWPLDKITVFLVPGVVGLIGVLITTVGRSGSAVTLTIAVVITGAATAYGATGFGDINKAGFLNGGCEVDAASDVDFTTVDDTSKQDPFVIDPFGGLTWVATSPTVFDDYPWEIWVDVGGVQVTIDSKESQDNDGGSQINSGDVSNVTEYAEGRNIPIDQLRGVFEVGGFAASCDGLAYVKFLAEPLETIIAKVAAAIAAIALIMLLRAALSGRGGSGGPSTVPNGPGDPNQEGDVDFGDVSGFGGGGAAAGGFASGDVDGDGDVDLGDMSALSGPPNGGDSVPGYEPGAEDLPNPEDQA